MKNAARTTAHRLTALATVVVAMTLAAAGCAPDSIEDFEIDEEVAHLVVGNDAGHVEIRGADTAAITVHAELYGEDVALERFTEDGVLHIESDIDWPCSYCRIDMVVTVPRDLSVEVSGGSSDVTVVGLEADLEASSGSGAVDVEGLRCERFVSSTGSGDIRAVGLDVDEADVGSGSGHLTLSFDTAPTTVLVGTGSGNQRITVPSGAYDVTWDAYSGHFDFDGIVLDPSAPSSMELETGSGDITLLGR